ncbi:MAG: M14 family zinc carboxypeptidase [Gemmatimonadota bacterium]
MRLIRLPATAAVRPGPVVRAVATGLAAFTLAVGLHAPGAAQADPDLLWGDAVPDGWNGDWPEALRTAPERTGYRRTTSTLDLHEYLATLKWRAEGIHVADLFISPLRRVAPVAVLAEPRVRTPGEAAASGKPVILLMGNIHPPESEATEALLMVMRDILLGDRAHLLDDLIIAVVPIYNVDGTETFRSQDGRLGSATPVIVGVRENSEGRDLNRDGVRLETVEGNGLYAFMNAWDPLLFLDGHTMGRVSHGYANAYATSTVPAAHPGPREYVTDTLFPAVRDRVREEFGLEVYTHALFDRRRPPTEWGHDYSAWTQEAKFVVNDYGLRNRMAIITETPGQPTFERRIYAQYAYILSLLEYVAEHAGAMQAVVDAADEETVAGVLDRAASGELRNWVAGEYRSRGPVEVLWYPDQTTEYVPGTSVRRTGSGTPGGVPVPIRVEDITRPVGTEDAWMPRGYLLPARLAAVAEKLEAHGIEVGVLKESMRAAGEQFVISGWHKERVRGYELGRLEGAFQDTVRTFPAGTFFVDMAQPMANAAFYYLEPRSADGFVAWNVMDAALRRAGADEPPAVYPVFKLRRELSRADRPRGET